MKISNMKSICFMTLFILLAYTAFVAAEDRTTLEEISETPLDSFENNKVKIASWSLNGIRAWVNKGGLKEFIDQVKPDILCLTDIRADYLPIKYTEIKKHLPSEFSCYFNLCKPPLSGKVGTAVFSKVKPISVKYGIGNETHDAEGRIITVEYDKFYVVGNLSPKAGAKLKNVEYKVKEYEKDLFDHVRSLDKKGKPVILAGNMNVARGELDIFNPKRVDSPAGYSIEEKESIENFLESGYIDTFRHLHTNRVSYTYFPLRRTKKDNEKGWRLNYVLASKSLENKIEEAEIIKGFHYSDYNPVTATISLT